MTSNSKQAWWAGWLLAIFLFAIYCLSYSGRLMSGDELRIIDGISSFVHFGDWKLDESFSFSMPNAVNTNVRYALMTLPNDERSIAILATPLYLLAHSIPSLGMFHTVWLYNVFTTIACGVLLYALGLRLGYRLNNALLCALVFGICTLVFPYSKTLFREPTTMLFLIVSLHFGLTVRQGRLRAKMVAFVLMICSFALALWVKNSSIFVLPALLVWVVPTIPSLSNVCFYRFAGVLLGLFVISVIVVTYITPFNAVFVQLVTPITRRIVGDSYYLQQAVHSYLFSLNGSVFTTSPILLSGIVGSFLLWKHGQGRMVWCVALAVIGYAFGHALLTNAYWYGGLSYPPRFMLPVITFAMLLVFPVGEKLLARGAWRWWFLFLPLVLFSFWVQVVNVLSFLESYTSLLPAEARGLSDWLPGLNLLQYGRWIMLPSLWTSIGYDLAWWRTLSPEWAVMVIASAIAILASIVVLLSGKGIRLIRVSTFMLTIGVVALCTWQLVALNTRDPLTKADSSALKTALAIAEQESIDGQPLLIAYGSLVPPVINSNRSSQYRPIALQQQLAPVDTSQPFEHRTSIYDLALPYTVRYMAQLATSNERVWLLTESSIYQPWAPRVEERYLTENAYLLREVNTGDASVRLLEYLTENQPDALAFANPDSAFSVEFGGNIRLTGVSFPRGVTYQAGQVLPVQLWWQAAEPIPYDLTVSTFLVPAQGGEPLVQGHDSAPVGGFHPTTRWQAEEIIKDRRALAIPSDAPSGDYVLWVLLYRFENGQPLREQVTIGDNLEGTIAVLPIPITISP